MSDGKSTLITGIGELVTNDGAPDDGKPDDGKPGAFAAMNDAALVIAAGQVAWTGPAARAPAADTVVDAAGRAVLPGFADSHAHLVFAGERSEEFAARMAGRPYRAGGIQVTVEATRAASDAALRANLRRLAAEMLRQGTTTFECKSGYGLTVPDEARALELAAEVTPEVTYLGAHVVPPEFAADPAGYVDLVCGPMLDACAPSARWVDVFCEDGAFGADEAAAILAAGRAAGLAARVHANQLGPGPGIRVAAEAGAASADHCTFLTDDDVDALVSTPVVATLLPGVEFSYQAAVPAGTPAARRGRHRGPGHRLQPRLLFHVQHAVLHRARGPRDADDHAGGGLVRHRGRRAGAAPDRHRAPQPRRPCRPDHAGRAVARLPGLSSRRPADRRGLAGGAPGRGHEPAGRCRGGSLIPGGQVAAAEPDERRRPSRPRTPRR